MIQYGKQTIEQQDINAIINVLTINKYLTTGPFVTQFENNTKNLLNVKHAVAVSNGTTALHCACLALELSEGDEVIVPAISFVATSNCVLYCGATPVFVDIDESTMNIDIDKIGEKINERTRAIIVVDFAGQLCDYDRLSEFGLPIISDACHSFGINKSLKADLTVFSFHPVKNITTGEGGMIVTNNDKYAKIMKNVRNHGIDKVYQNRTSYEYDVTKLGFNYRLTDIQAALGISQLQRIHKWLEKRNQIANKYTKAFKDNIHIQSLELKELSAYHIYVIKLIDIDRDEFYRYMIDNGIGVNVHYKPIYLHSYYRSLGYEKGLCPVAEKVYNQIITIPIYPTITDEDVEKVIKIVNSYLF